VNWFHLVQDRDKWRDLVNTVIELSGSMKGRGFLNS
jgi:cobalamin biosynthesis protein CobT